MDSSAPKKAGEPLTLGLLYETRYGSGVDQIFANSRESSPKLLMMLRLLSVYSVTGVFLVHTDMPAWRSTKIG